MFQEQMHPPRIASIPFSGSFREYYEKRVFEERENLDRICPREKSYLLIEERPTTSLQMGINSYVHTIYSDLVKLLNLKLQQ